MPAWAIGPGHLAKPQGQGLKARAMLGEHGTGFQPFTSTSTSSLPGPVAQAGMVRAFGAWGVTASCIAFFPRLRHSRGHVAQAFSGCLLDDDRLFRMFLCVSDLGGAA